MTPLAQWTVKNYTPEVRNVGSTDCVNSNCDYKPSALAVSSNEFGEVQAGSHLAFSI
jgi:hypothetical protein